MITEDYVSFETAKLLKEKGFENDAISCINVFKGHIYKIQDRIINVDDDVTIPTTQMTIKWLEETYHILVVVDYIYEFTDTSWVYKIYRLGENGEPERCAVKGVSYDENNNPTEHIVGYRDYDVSYKDYATRKEAEDEGIRYVLENLI